MALVANPSRRYTESFWTSANAPRVIANTILPADSGRASSWKWSVLQQSVEVCTYVVNFPHACMHPYLGRRSYDGSSRSYSNASIWNIVWETTYVAPVVQLRTVERFHMSEMQPVMLRDYGIGAPVEQQNRSDGKRALFKY